ncbi:hypothetical protein [Hathewaya massiliensis]|nr:hypothetical protein [Hathewaya massiliensis]
MTYNKRENRKAKKSKTRSDKPVTIEDHQIEKHKSKGVIRAEEY